MIKPLILVLAFLFTTVCAASPDVATDRVIAFLTNAHTGKQMRADEWLTKKVRSAEKFVAFGGLDAMVRQSTTRAERFGGLKSVEILDTRKDGSDYVIAAEVHFNKDHRRPDNPAKAPNEDMVWRFRAINERGAWLLEF